MIFKNFSTRLIQQWVCFSVKKYEGRRISVIINDTELDFIPEIQIQYVQTTSVVQQILWDKSITEIRNFIPKCDLHDVLITEKHLWVWVNSLSTNASSIPPIIINNNVLYSSKNYKCVHLFQYYVLINQTPRQIIRLKCVIIVTSLQSLSPCIVFLAIMWRISSSELCFVDSDNWLSPCEGDIYTFQHLVQYKLHYIHFKMCFHYTN